MTHGCMPQRGFTLLELVVALAISSLVTLVGASAMSMALDAYQRHADRSRNREDIRSAERILRHEWTARGQWARSDGASLEFITLHPLLREPQPDLMLALVRYACAPSAAAQGWEITRSVAVATAGGAAASAPPRWRETRLLASGLTHCAFSFLGEVRAPGGTLQPRWLTHWDPAHPAPQLMRLSLSHSDRMPPVVYIARTGGAAR